MRTQSGFALITALIFLVLMTLLGVAMFNGFTLDQIMAGNLREKSRALDASQTAINTAESWLSISSNATDGVVCATGLYAGAQVCSNAVPTQTWPWTTGTAFTPTGMSVALSGTGTYAALPMYYIQVLSPPGAATKYYRITAAASGGNNSAVAIVETVFRVSQQTRQL